MKIVGDSSVDAQVKAALVAVDDDEPTVEQRRSDASLTAARKSVKTRLGLKNQP